MSSLATTTSTLTLTSPSASTSTSTSFVCLACSCCCWLCVGIWFVWRAAYQRAATNSAKFCGCDNVMAVPRLLESSDKSLRLPEGLKTFNDYRLSAIDYRLSIILADNLLIVAHFWIDLFGGCQLVLNPFYLWTNMEIQSIVEQVPSRNLNLLVSMNRNLSQIKTSEHNQMFFF